jgi:hypothetical protein
MVGEFRQQVSKVIDDLTGNGIRFATRASPLVIDLRPVCALGF